MKAATRKKLGVGLLLLFVGIVLVSLQWLKSSAVPSILFPVFLPGIFIAALFQGGNFHAIGDAEVPFWNIVFWALALGVPGIYCFLAERSTPGDLPPIGGAG